MKMALIDDDHSFSSMKMALIDDADGPDQYVTTSISISNEWVSLEISERPKNTTLRCRNKNKKKRKSGG